MSEFHTDAGAAGRRHSDVGPELRNLAEAVLDRLDPAVRLLAARVQASGPGKCEQRWCPVCALTAVISGEQHPMLDVVADHSVALLTLVKAMLDNFDGGGIPPQPAGPAPEDPTEASEPAPTDPAEPGPNGSAEPGRYQHIRVIVDE
ncbi:MAG: hypothetical protein V3U55_03240 [Mycobacterium sp.]